MSGLSACRGTRLDRGLISDFCTSAGRRRGWGRGGRGPIAPVVLVGRVTCGYDGTQRGGIDGLHGESSIWFFGSEEDGWVVP